MCMSGREDRMRGEATTDGAVGGFVLFGGGGAATKANSLGVGEGRDVNRWRTNHPIRIG